MSTEQPPAGPPVAPPPMTGGPAPLTPQPEVRKTPLTIIALVLAILSALVVGIGLYVAITGIDAMDYLKNGDAALGPAVSQMMIWIGISGLLGLTAFILAIIAVVKSKPKVFPIIVLVVTLVLPGIFTGISIAAANAYWNGQAQKMIEQTG